MIVVVRLDRSQFPLHAIWALPAVIVSVFGVGWYLVASWRFGAWLGGGSAVGLACGVTAGLIVLFEMLLWPRKGYRRWRLGATKHWMAAHIWFGLACLPLAVVHSGFHWGGALPALLLALLILTVVSGVVGLALQNILPQWMLRHLPAETIYSQIDYVSEQAVEDSRRLLVAACGAPPTSANHDQDVAITTPSFELESTPTAIVVGAVRELGRARGRTLRTTAATANRLDREILWNALAELEPFLRSGSVQNVTLADSSRANKYFNQLRRSCHEESAAIIDLLEQQCDQRRQFDIQRRVHLWLHAWIPVHLGLSVALMLLLFVHVWTAFKYW